MEETETWGTQGLALFANRTRHSRRDGCVKSPPPYVTFTMDTQALMSPPVRFPSCDEHHKGSVALSGPVDSFSLTPALIGVMAPRVNLPP